MVAPKPCEILIDPAQQLDEIARTVLKLPALPLGKRPLSLHSGLAGVGRAEGFLAPLGSISAVADAALHPYDIITVVLLFALAEAVSAEDGVHFLPAVAAGVD
jgi:hypothetical protein